MDAIIELEHHVYLIGHTIIWAMDEDMFAGVDRDAELMRMYRSANSRFSTRPYGDLSVHGYAVNKDPDHPNSRYAALGMRHAMDLSEDAKAILRKEMPEHAGEF